MFQKEFFIGFLLTEYLWNYGKILEINDGKIFYIKVFHRLNSVSLATDPPIKPQLSNSSVPPGTENLNKSPQAGKNSYTLNIFNNNIYTNFKTAYTHVNSAMVLCSIIIWVTNSSDYRRVWTANLLHTK